MLKRVDEEQNLDRLAEVTVRRALDDAYPQAMAAAKEIGDRLDGKAMQPTENETNVSGELVIHWGKAPT